MKFQSVQFFGVSQNGKYVRFKTPATLENLSNQFMKNNKLPPQITFPSGSIGLIYRVVGGTMYIGFQKDFKTPPSKGLLGSPELFDATVQIHIGRIDTIEVEG